MKVAELIDRLKEFDPDHDVLIDLDLDPHLGLDDLVIPDKIYEGGNWNIVITLTQ